MFPERLRALRKGQKITLKELANHLNQNLGPNEKPNTASQIGNWERGFERHHTLKPVNWPNFSMLASTI
jgi:hypothetical protein